MAAPPQRCWRNALVRIRRVPKIAECEQAGRRALAARAGRTVRGSLVHGRTACTAVGSFIASANGESLAERWNGRKWTIRHAPNPRHATMTFLDAVSCASGTACTAVGYYNQESGHSLTLAERGSP